MKMGKLPPERVNSGLNEHFMSGFDKNDKGFRHPASSGSFLNYRESGKKDDKIEKNLFLFMLS